MLLSWLYIENDGGVKLDGLNIRLYGLGTVDNSFL